MSVEMQLHDDRLRPLLDAFAGIADTDPDYSSQLTVYVGGELAIDATVGSGLQPDSLLPVFSSTKGATAITIGLLVERGQLDLDAPVIRYWPEFGQCGKSAVVVRQLLSHQAGLVGVDGGFSTEELFEHTALAQRVAAQRPYWQPGQAFLYHALTIGVLADELARRIDGRSVAQLFREDVVASRGIDFFMGVPELEDDRVVPFLLPDNERLMAALADTVQDVDGIATRSMPEGGALAVLGAVNELPFRRAAAPAAGGFANARGLARLYAAIHHDLGAPRLLSDDTVAQLAQTQVFGDELGTGLQARFGVIFQAPVAPRWGWGSFRAFGHDGAGGSLAFSDPHYDVAFGYTVQRMPWPGGVDSRAIELTRVLRRCLAA